MALTYAEAVDYVFGFTNYEFTPLVAAPAGALELARLRSLLRRLGDPQLSARAVHITGSKGKGSTAAMIEALLRKSGARTGLYTSPHLHTPRERIAVDGEPVSEAEFAALVDALRPHADAENATCPSPLTTFELLTALGFLAFREHGCDWQVVEVGLGGRLDATNVLDVKELCVFTPISLEHTAILGPTTAIIAADKAGILRRGASAVTAPQDEQAAAVLRQACAELDVPLSAVAEQCRWSAATPALDGQKAGVRTPRAEYRLGLPLLGAHQVENAVVALRGVELLRPAGVRLSPEQAAGALASVRWPGRLEVLSLRPLILADGAHNAASAQRLAEALRDLLTGSILPLPQGHGDGEDAWEASGPARVRLILTIGTLADKDLDGIAAALAPLAAEVVAVEPGMARARPAGEIAAAFAAQGIPASVAESVAAGLREAIARAGSDGAICVAGSLYTVAEARAALLEVAGS